MVIPCYECVCLPVCRHKMFLELIRQCELVNDYLYKLRGDNQYRYRWPRDRFWPRAVNTETVLQPTCWKMGNKQIVEKKNEKKDTL
ncbi:MAG: hypothetical protein ACTSW1_07720 [Candidatus Hodarchaeales archaeon]